MNVTQTKAERAVKCILNAATPSQHLHSLSAMCIEWMRNTNEDNEQERQEVYLTFVVLRSALKIMEEPSDE
jgi:hypothetical protein